MSTFYETVQAVNMTPLCKCGHTPEMHLYRLTNSEEWLECRCSVIRCKCMGVQEQKLEVATSLPQKGEL